MTPRKPTQKTVDVVSAASVENAMQTLEVPSTQPLVRESSTQRMAWVREIQNARDEQGLIDEQRESLIRIFDFTAQEAMTIYNATCETAGSVRNRSIADAESIKTAGLKVLDARYDDLEKVVAGLSAAVGASE